MQKTGGVTAGWLFLLASSGCGEHGSQPLDAWSPAGLPCSAPLALDIASYRPPPACTAAGAFDFPSTEQALALLGGSWLLCSSQSVFHSFNEIGLQLGPGDRWFKVFPDGTGGTRPGTGTGNEGTWFLQTNRPHAELVLVPLAPGASVIAAPQFTFSPLRMRIDGGAGVVAEYIRNDSLGRCQL